MAAEQLKRETRQSKLDLNMASVFAYEISIKHFKDLRPHAKSLKVKLRINDQSIVPIMKTDFVQSAFHRVVFDTTSRFVFEGGDTLTFELCEPGWMFGSTLFASVAMSLQELMKGLNGTQRMRRSLQVLAADAAHSEVGTLVIEARVFKTTLGQVGGPDALRTLHLRDAPLTSAHARLEAASGLSYSRQCDAVQGCIEHGLLYSRRCNAVRASIEQGNKLHPKMARHMKSEEKEKLILESERKRRLESNEKHSLNASPLKRGASTGFARRLTAPPRQPRIELDSELY